MKKFCLLFCLFSMFALSGAAQSNFIDFTSPDLVTFGEDARVMKDGIMMLRAGNASGDDTIKFSGEDGDVAAMIAKVGEDTQSLIVPGYSKEDLNLDGFVKLNGANNDRVFLLNALGFFTPFVVYKEQLP